MDGAIRRLHGEYGCRVINISLGDILRPAKDRPSAWAAVLDELARELDLVIVVSAGNASTSKLAALGENIVETYPGYLFEETNRILEPATAVNVISVGAIAHASGIAADDAEYVGVLPIADTDQLSPITRVGPGVGGIIKPDFVDYGGTAVFDGPTQRVVTGTHRSAAGMITLHHNYLQRLLSSRSGTSFASPLVAHKACLIREAFPHATANLVRALLALSAEYPSNGFAPLQGIEDGVIRGMGYGLPNVENALSSEDSRVILYREDELPLDRFAIYEVPIPRAYQSAEGRKQIRVALAFDAPVRHTRYDYAGISMGFSLFRGVDVGIVFDACRRWEQGEGDPQKVEDRYKCKLEPGPQRRERGTLQCGLFTAKNSLEPYRDTYFLAVRCEAGWARDIDRQRFAVAVELRHEAEIRLYEQIRARVRVRA